MLEQLIQLTNSLDFVENGHFSVLEVIAPPPRNKVVFKLEALVEDPQSHESTRQVWEVTCLDVLDMGGLLDYNWPYSRLNIYKDHPVLYNYESARATLRLAPPYSNSTDLLGSLYMAHDAACGHWVNFQNTIYRLTEQLQKGDNKVELSIPTPLVQAYSKACQQQGVSCTVVNTREAGYTSSKLQALILGAPEACPDDFRLWQPYVVAHRFEEKRIE
jgi:hypothetical protein